MKSPPINLQPEDLSALCDGEADASVAAAASLAWRDDAQLRARWHSFHLIGDVLRSEDLARPAAADATFLQALRERLAAEPVVLAPTAEAGGAASPTPSQAPARSVARRRWMGSGAIAAGFVAVLGSVFVLRAPSGVEAGSAQMAAGPATAVPALVAAVEAVPTPRALVAEPTRAIAANGSLLRDAGLDRYLAAHQQFGGNSALAVPSGFMRNATYEGPSR
ncbi:sigma-E factor negative regulatory protein [Rivibacter subsaxonicus]|uniref:RseA-like anti sigma(E) protein n=1 Tax=Rivibacter subsaxonicus TaxID=457575 RepID=A0A4Q7VGU6_9BURK|nr:RseA family anti-sigma factor [Rivibacter subsaxonicus]RZT95271.1 RseA-like anti sigma(E) protein [Rivibacter subsaxonicus]